MAGDEDTEDGPPPRPSPPRRRREGIVIEGKPVLSNAQSLRSAPVRLGLRAFAAAALGGAIGAALTLAGVFWAGRADLAPLGERAKALDAAVEAATAERAELTKGLAAVEKALGGAGAQNAALAAAKDDLAALSRRVAALDAATRAGAERLAAAEKAVGETQAQAAAMKDDLANAARASEDRALAAARAEAAANRARLDALEAAPLAAAGSPATAKAIAASALRRRLDAGEPLADQLAALERLGVAATALAPLRPYAASGAPSLAALARALSGLAPRFAASDAPAASDAGPFGRILRELQGLAKIRKVGESRAAEAVAHADGALERGDLAGALAALGDLPPPARAAAEGWIEAAQARLAANRTAEALVRETAADPGGARR